MPAGVATYRVRTRGAQVAPLDRKGNMKKPPRHAYAHRDHPLHRTHASSLPRSTRKRRISIVLDLRKASAFTDVFVICTGKYRRVRHADAIQAVARPARSQLVKGRGRAGGCSSTTSISLSHLHAGDASSMDSSACGPTPKIEVPLAGSPADHLLQSSAPRFLRGRSWQSACTTAGVLATTRARSFVCARAGVYRVPTSVGSALARAVCDACWSAIDPSPNPRAR